MHALRRVMTVGTPSNRAFRLLLLGLAVIFIAMGDANHLLFVYPYMVDLEIPIQATQRWVDGGDPYLASSFITAPGSTPPFLYPPYFLVLLRPLVGLPDALVQSAWLAILLASSVLFVRRLAFPAWSWLIVLAWPPFLEPIIGGNVQLVFLAGFAWIFWRSSPAAPFQPRDRDLADPAEPGSRIGLVASLISWMKVSQPHTWLYVLRRRPVDALMGAAIVGALVAATIPITGIELWTDWFVQLRRAADPAWEPGGIAIARLVNPAAGFFVVLVSFALILLVVPARRAGAWVGILAVVGAPSLHTFGVLFLIPAMLVIRREIALVAGVLIATTTYEGTWAGILIVSLAMLFGLRWPGLLEPDASQPAPATHSAAGARDVAVPSG